MCEPELQQRQLSRSGCWLPTPRAVLLLGLLFGEMPRVSTRLLTIINYCMASVHRLYEWHIDWRPSMWPHCCVAFADLLQAGSALVSLVSWMPFNA